MKLDIKTQALQGTGQKALVPFFVAGYPDRATFRKLLSAAAAAGCPIIEVGVPFSDPIADGPVIQEASQVALSQGMTLAKALDLCAEASTCLDSDLVVMGYINPVMRMGLEVFADRAANSGVSGVVVPDLPLEESSALRRILSDAGITLVNLVAPTTSEDRVARISAVAGGFVYLVSVTGVTGARVDFESGLPGFGRKLQQAIQRPVYVGFGVSTSAQAVRICEWADGVIIGSALIRMIQEAGDGDAAVSAVSAYLSAMNRALNPDHVGSEGTS